MVVVEDNFEIRPYYNLTVPEITRAFPMWLKKEDGDEFTNIHLSDYSEPESGTIYTIINMYEVVDVVDSHPAGGVWMDGIEQPTWYNVRCRRVDYLQRYNEDCKENEICVQILTK